MISDSLGICGLDEDVSAFLEFEACSPLDARSFHQESATVKICCLHVLNDENYGQLKPENLRVEMKQTEPSVAVRKLSLSGHCNDTDHTGHGPKNLAIRYGRGILPELQIPPQLKSLRTLYNFARREPDGLLEPAPSGRFLVNSDVRPGDLLDTLVWNANRHDTEPQWDLAYVILRRTTFADESGSRVDSMSLEDDSKQRRTAFFLHSWAIPVHQICSMLSGIDGIYRFVLPPVAAIEEENDTERLVLHYRGALVPLLLSYHPLQSLLYSKSALNPEATNLSSRVEDPEDLLERLEKGRGSKDEGRGCMCRNLHGSIVD